MRRTAHCGVQGTGCRVQGSTAHALLHRVLCTVPCTAHAALHCVPCTVPHTLSYTLHPTPCTAPFSIPCSVLHLALCPVQHAVQSTLNITGTVQYCIVQHSTAQLSSAQHSTARHGTARHSTAQHSTEQCVVYTAGCGAQYRAQGTGPSVRCRAEYSTVHSAQCTVHSA